MRPRTWKIAAAAIGLLSTTAFGAGPNGFELSVLVDGAPRPEYQARGTVYVEALRGREYTLRITNPLPYRVAVALSVDGLNTIDAKRSDPWKASKWVLQPYESTVISGWQVNDSAARRFFFTGERSSYGAFLGQTQNLGVLEAVFYRERRVPRPLEYESHGEYDRRDLDRQPPGAGMGSAAPQSEQAPRKSEAVGPKPQLSDEYAATGMGGRTQHDVTTVSIDLDPRPVASVRIRYEFRPQLTKLGIFPESPRALERRERATGFAYCPDPGY